MRQTGGNPLALVELPGSLTPAQLAGQEPLPADLPLTEGVQRVFLDRSRRLSAARADPAVCRRRRRFDQGERGPAGRGTARRRPGRVDRGGGIRVADHRRGRDRFPSPACPFRRLSGGRDARSAAGAPGAGPGDDRRAGRGPAGLAPRRGGRRTRRRCRRRAGRRRPARGGPGWLRGRQRGVRTGRRADRGRDMPAAQGFSPRRPMRGWRRSCRGRCAWPTRPAPASPTPWCGPTWTGSAAGSSSSPVPSRSGSGSGARPPGTWWPPTRSGPGRSA